MFKGFSHILLGINGAPEISRVVGAFGALAYVVGAHVFLGYDVMYLGHQFDLTAYCLAFPGGLAVIGGGTAGAVALKDRNVAAAKVIEATGSKPADPPAPAPQVQPALAPATTPTDEVANL